MKTMLFKKTILVALIFALALAAFPLTGVSAAEPIPSNGRLERVWARLNRRDKRLGEFFARSDELVARAEKMIAYLKDHDESAADLEAALAAYQDAVQQAKPIYQSSQGIVNAHKGFNASGESLYRTHIPWSAFTSPSNWYTAASLRAVSGG